MFAPIPMRGHIRIEQKHLIAEIHFALMQMESRRRAMEAAFGHVYKYNPNEPRLPGGQPGGGSGGSGIFEEPVSASPNGGISEQQPSPTGGGIDEFPHSKPNGGILNEVDDVGEGGEGGGGTVMDDSGHIYPEYEDILVPDTWADPDFENFENHFEKHTADFGTRSPNDYADHANQFYERFQTENLPAIEYPNAGRIAAYDPDSNTLGIYNSEGKTVSLYKPDDGRDYFRQLMDTQVTRGGRIINPMPVEEPVISDIVIP